MSESSRGRIWLLRILAAMFAVSFVVSTVAVWANYRIQDSDAWARTVAPLASDPAIQDRIVDQTSLVIENQMRADEGAGVLRTITVNQTIPLVRGLLTGFVESSAFADFWRDANYVAHKSIIFVIDGGEGDLIRTDGQSLVIDIQPVIDWLNPQLNAFLPGSNYMITLAPDRTTIVLFSSEGIERVVNTFDVVDRLAFIMPIVTIVSLAGALLVASKRMAAVGRLALTLAVTAAIVLAVITIAKVIVINGQPVTAQDAIAAILRIVLIDLVGAFRVTAAAGLIVFGLASLGQSRYAHDPRVRAWIRQYREAVAGAGIGVATIYLVLTDSPSLWLAVLSLVVMTMSAIALVVWRRQDAESVHDPAI